MGRSHREVGSRSYPSRTVGDAESRPRPAGRESRQARGARAQAICERLAELYPAARCSLDFRSPFELLIATILSPFYVAIKHLEERWFSGEARAEEPS